MVKTLEGDRYALCEKLFLFPFCCSHQMHRYLAGCFGLISGRHCLVIIANIIYETILPILNTVDFIDAVYGIVAVVLSFIYLYFLDKKGFEEE